MFYYNTLKDKSEEVISNFLEKALTKPYFIGSSREEKETEQNKLD